MGYRTWLGLLGGSFVITLSSVGAAAESERFGTQGQVVIDHPLVAAGRQDSYAEGFEAQGFNVVTIAPALSVFVLPRLSLGAGVRWSHYWSDSYSQDGFSWRAANMLSVEPELGYAVPLAEELTLWPRASVSLERSWAGPFDLVSMSAGAYAPLLWHPVSHFFVGLGPAASWRYAGRSIGSLQASSRDLSIRSVFGGYF